MLDFLDGQPDFVHDCPAGPEHGEIERWGIAERNGGWPDLLDVLNDPEALRIVVWIRKHTEDGVVELVDELGQVTPRVGLDLVSRRQRAL